MKNTILNALKKWIAIISIISIGLCGIYFFTKVTTTDEEKENKEVVDLNEKRTDKSSNKDKEAGTKIKTKDEEKSSISDKIICIDPGHQLKGNLEKEAVAPNSKIVKFKCSSGTVGVSTKIREEKLNLEVGLLLKQKLINEGAKVVMTRETSKVDISNVERAEISNKANSDVFIRIHTDGSENHNVAGISVLVPNDKYIKDKKMLQRSYDIGSCVLKSVVEHTKAKNKGIIKRGDISGFNWSKKPVILIEMGFMTNPDEDKKLNAKQYQNKIVEGIIDGLKRYFDQDNKNSR
ncbi:N-acetylmuramoyl-L-alanine amidase [Clostridiaceae bacterium M8S5]|nr:N-acetylmuramoyl-L-alanine amidase [Clostridiaceae bacterium M8S5]